MIVGCVHFRRGFRTLLDNGYGIYDRLLFSLPRLGAARNQIFGGACSIFGMISVAACGAIDLTWPELA